MRSAAWVVMLVLGGAVARAETFDEQVQAVDKLAAAGRLIEADDVAERLLDGSVRQYGETHDAAMQLLSLLARIRVERKQGESAERLYDRACAICEKLHGPNHVGLAFLLMGRSVAHTSLEKFALAEAGFTRALAIFDQNADVDQRSIAECLRFLALAKAKVGKFAEAVPLLARSEAVFEKTNGPAAPETVAVHDLRCAIVNALDQQAMEEGRAGARKPAVEKAPFSLVDYGDRVGETLTFEVEGTAQGGYVWGSNPYTADSNLAAAAVHAGAVEAGKTSVISVTILAGAPSYAGTTSNGVTSGDWGPFELGFRVNGRRANDAPADGARTRTKRDAVE